MKWMTTFPSINRVLYYLYDGFQNFNNDFIKKLNMEWSTDSICEVKLCVNGWQLAKMKKSIPDMSLP